MTDIQKWRALAVGAHPDDIEFMMAGTLLLLKEAGAEIHMWNLANGSCGTATYNKEDIIRLRWEEAQASAQQAGATIYPPLVDDLSVIYEPFLLARVTAILRTIKPNILLIPSPQDYMEDHQNTSRLMVSAAFSRGMRNFRTNPVSEPWDGDIALYHAMPYGLRDGLRTVIRSEHYIDISSVLSKKRELLIQHTTQKEWLDTSQGMDAYLHAMEGMARTMGKMSRHYEYAEGWRRHLPLGLSGDEFDPLVTLLRSLCWTDPDYIQSLGNLPE